MALYNFKWVLANNMKVLNNYPSYYCFYAMYREGCLIFNKIPFKLITMDV